MIEQLLMGREVRRRLDGRAREAPEKLMNGEFGQTVALFHASRLKASDVGPETPVTVGDPDILKPIRSITLSELRRLASVMATARVTTKQFMANSALVNAFESFSHTVLDGGELAHLDIDNFRGSRPTGSSLAIAETASFETGQNGFYSRYFALIKGKTDFVGLERVELMGADGITKSASGLIYNDLSTVLEEIDVDTTGFVLRDPARQIFPGPYLSISMFHDDISEADPAHVTRAVEFMLSAAAGQ